MASATSISLLFSSILLSATTFVNGQNFDEQLWCVPKAGTNNQALQANLDYACGSIDCKGIQPGGSCYEPNTVKDHAAWAMNTFYQSLGKKDSDCDFKGTGNLVVSDPSPAGCKFVDGKNMTGVAAKRWCVPREEATDQQLQSNIDYACGAGRDCKPILQGGSCFEPNTVKSHAAYAMNTFYQTLGHQHSDCNFKGSGKLVSSDPSNFLS
ncbi:glucan endo-1,3-beta-glucosidase 12-like [Euphorbia lathyris]|uniref:glucan endo-1,3-beta-glucosidase 12-like n=1 Tax=Euphorbia lathyris TaxID=212925 RepID=UPI0033131137